MTLRYCLTLDLKNDPDLIARYKDHHKQVWPEIVESIKDSGVEEMDIYLLGTRLLMVLEVNESFSFEKKARLDEENAKVREWEQLMSRFQQQLPEAKPGQKWVVMEQIFKLENDRNGGAERPQAVIS